MLFFSPTYTSLERCIKRGQNSLQNHILSLHHDSQYVQQIEDIFPTFQLIANLRNGLWYHETYDTHCYFKSTDGHEDYESFSMIRLNLNVAESIAQSSGGIIVDSTRRGKSYPDSFKTVIPIWVAIINVIVFNDGNDFSMYFNPPPIMSSTQVKRICQKMQLMLSSVEFQPFKTLIAEKLSLVLQKPLRTFFCSVSGDGSLDWLSEDIEDVLDAQFTVDSTFSGSPHIEPHSSSSSSSSSSTTTTKQGSAPRVNSDLPYHPVILFSCSTYLTEFERLARREFHSWTYMQGAGDDAENWGEGLTPELFWKHLDELLPMSDSIELSQFISKIVTDSKIRKSESGGEVGNVNTVEPTGIDDSKHNYIDDIIHIPGTRILFMPLSNTVSDSPSNSTELYHKVLSSISSKYTLSGVVIASDLESSHRSQTTQASDSSSISINSSGARASTVQEAISASEHRHTMVGGHAIRILNLEVSSEKKNRAHMHSRWSSYIFPSLLNFASTTSINSLSSYLSSTGHENDTFLLVCCEDWSVATVLLAALLLQIYPHLVLTNNASVEPEVTTVESADPAIDSNCVHRRWKKNDIKYILSILQQSHLLLQCSRMLMKELSSYFLK